MIKKTSFLIVSSRKFWRSALKMASSSAKTPKLQLASEQPLTEECWIPPKKDSPCPRRSPSKMLGGVKLCLESNPIHAKDVQRAQTKPCVHQDPGERSSDPTIDWLRLACECPGVSSGGVGRWPAAGLGALSAAVHAGTFWRRWHYLHHLHHSLVSSQTTGREHSPTHQQKIGLKIYWAWPRPSEQDPVSPTVSLSHQEASVNLLSLSVRGQTEWKPQSQKTNQTDHMDHSLV